MDSEPTESLDRLLRRTGWSVSILALVAFASGLVQYRGRGLSISIDFLSLWMIYLGFRIRDQSRSAARWTLGITIVILAMYVLWGVLLAAGLKANNIGSHRFRVGLLPEGALSIGIEVIRALWYLGNGLLLLRCFALWRRLDRRAARRCEECGYDLRSSTERCPECGTVFEEARPQVLIPITHPREGRG